MRLKTSLSVATLSFVAAFSMPTTAAAEPVVPIRRNGPDENRVNIAILGDGYAQGDQVKYSSDVDRLARAAVADLAVGPGVRDPQVAQVAHPLARVAAGRQHPRQRQRGRQAPRVAPRRARRVGQHLAQRGGGAASELRGRPGGHLLHAARGHEVHRLAIVADGMGGHASGDIASRLAVDTITDHFQATADQQPVTETLCSRLLKSNCLVTGQPDWGSVQIQYSGPQIEQEGLLQYLVSFRNHNEFHEQCVERIFMDIWTRCQPIKLTVYARYTRRGGLDINPLRTSYPQQLPANTRTARQ